MLNTQQILPWMFNLEGTVLGFSGKDPDKPKSLILEIDQEPMPIKLPKKLRISLPDRLQPGDRINCIGRSQIDFDTGVIKLEAMLLFSLPPTSDESLPVHSPSSIALASSPKSRRALHPPKLKKAKILVCKKSGCKKRGEFQLVETLKRVLQDHQLQDQVEIQYSGCQKRCSKAPSLTIMPGKHRYERLTPKNLPAIVQEHFCASESRSAPNHVEK